MQLNELEDGKLVELTLLGREDAFEHLVLRYAGMVAGCLHLGEEYASECEEMRQEVFLLAYRKLNHLQRPDRFGPWLARIARNTRSDFLRKELRRPKKLPLEPLSERGAPVAEPREPGPGPSQTLEQEETVGFVSEAVASLKETYRSVIYMRLFEEMPLNLIAERLGLRESAVRMRMQRGLAQLRKRLEQLEEQR